MSDSRKPDVILAQLEVEEVGPYVVGLSNSKRISFPDPGAMNAFEADEFATDLMSAKSAADVFKRWLSEADFQKLKEEKNFNLYKMKKLMSTLQKHYEAAFGTQGEDIAS